VACAAALVGGANDTTRFTPPPAATIVTRLSIAAPLSFDSNRVRLRASVLATHRSPVTGLCSIAYSVVPTPVVTDGRGAIACASIGTTSRSASCRVRVGYSESNTMRPALGMYQPRASPDWFSAASVRIGLIAKPRSWESGTSWNSPIWFAATSSSSVV
jgi:hypothetical protein